MGGPHPVGDNIPVNGGRVLAAALLLTSVGSTSVSEVDADEVGALAANLEAACHERPTLSEEFGMIDCEVAVTNQGEKPIGNVRGNVVTIGEHAVYGNIFRFEVRKDGLKSPTHPFDVSADIGWMNPRTTSTIELAYIIRRDLPVSGHVEIYDAVTGVHLDEETVNLQPAAEVGSQVPLTVEIQRADNFHWYDLPPVPEWPLELRLQSHREEVIDSVEVEIAFSTDVRFVPAVGDDWEVDLREPHASIVVGPMDPRNGRAFSLQFEPIGAACAHVFVAAVVRYAEGSTTATIAPADFLAGFCDDSDRLPLAGSGQAQRGEDLSARVIVLSVLGVILAALGMARVRRAAAGRRRGR